MHNIPVDFAQMNLVEIQSDSLEEIAREKAKSAFSQVGRPVIVEDDGLFIDESNGFPGQYSSFALKTLGYRFILKLLVGSSDRSASFRSLIEIYDGIRLSIYEGLAYCRISEKLAEGSL